MLLRRLLRTTLYLLLAGLLLVGLLAAWVAYRIGSHDTVNLPPRYGQVDEQLFVGNGERHTLLVGLGGSEGGNAWASEHWKGQRQRFLDQGYALLAVGYFGGPNSPAQLDRIALEGVLAAIERAAANPQVDGRCVVLIGGSKGAELALSLAARAPQVDAVVAIVPGSAVFPSLTDAMTTSSYAWQGAPLPFVEMPWSATGALLSGDLRQVFSTMLEDPAARADAAIPVERINGPLLFVSATRDEMWPSREMADMMMARLDAAGFAHAHEHIAIEGGHTAPLEAFAEVERFLATTVRGGALPDCARR